MTRKIMSFVSIQEHFFEICRNTEIKKRYSIYKIKHKLPKESKITIMMKQPYIHDKITLLISEYKQNKISDEDKAAVEGLKYARSKAS